MKQDFVQCLALSSSSVRPWGLGVYDHIRTSRKVSVVSESDSQSCSLEHHQTVMFRWAPLSYSICHVTAFNDKLVLKACSEASLSIRGGALGSFLGLPSQDLLTQGGFPNGSHISWGFLENNQLDAFKFQHLLW